MTQSFMAPGVKLEAVGAGMMLTKAPIHAAYVVSQVTMPSVASGAMPGAIAAAAAVAKQQST